MKNHLSYISKPIWTYRNTENTRKFVDELNRIAEEKGFPKFKSYMKRFKEGWESLEKENTLEW